MRQPKYTAAETGGSGASISLSANLFKNPDEPIYTISIAAKLVRPIRNADGDLRPLHAQTLRTYEREGLVKPKRVGRNRLYSDRDIQRLQQIQHFTQEHGVNLAGVEIILDLLEHVQKMEGEMEALRRREGGATPPLLPAAPYPKIPLPRKPSPGS